jgi:protein-S-isoprenylcysteine O-methyltransferase Ste14
MSALRRHAFDEFVQYCGEKIECTPSFVCELVISNALFVATFYLYLASGQTAPSTFAVIVIAAIVLCTQAIKVALMFWLDWRGGDASSKPSHVLVTHGIYSYSRNPAYLLTVLQDALWALCLLIATIGTGDGLGVTAFALISPIVHFVVLDRYVIRAEEAKLLNGHPSAYPAYFNSVNRWIGRRRPGAQLALSASSTPDK